MAQALVIPKTADGRG